MVAGDDDSDTALILPLFLSQGCKSRRALQLSCIACFIIDRFTGFLCSLVSPTSHDVHMYISNFALLVWLICVYIIFGFKHWCLTFKRPIRRMCWQHTISIFFIISTTSSSTETKWHLTLQTRDVTCAVNHAPRHSRICWHARTKTARAGCITKNAWRSSSRATGSKRWVGHPLHLFVRISANKGTKTRPREMNRNYYYRGAICQSITSVVGVKSMPTCMEKEL